MKLKKDEIRALLQGHDLRATGPRIAVIRCLSVHGRPLAHSEVVTYLAGEDLDPATVYRNLVKLVEVGIARVVSHAEGMARYELALEQHGDHKHAHFVCTDCGTIACLPAEIGDRIEASGVWAEAVREATVQLQGTCPECRH